MLGEAACRRQVPAVAVCRVSSIGGVNKWREAGARCLSQPPNPAGWGPLDSDRYERAAEEPAYTVDDQDGTEHEKRSPDETTAPFVEGPLHGAQ